MPRDTVSACSTLRGTSVRCAEVVPVNVWRASSWYKSPLCPVVPCRAFPTPRSMKARYAACDSGQRDPAERSCSYQFQRGRLCASTLLCIKARAQPARAADAAPRRARSCLFQRQVLLQRDSHLLAAAPLTRNPFGGLIYVSGSSSIIYIAIIALSYGCTS